MKTADSDQGQESQTQVVMAKHVVEPVPVKRRADCSINMISNIAFNILQCDHTILCSSSNFLKDRFF